MKQIIKRKLFCSLLLFTLLLGGVILFQPRPVAAASKIYEINISKTSASAAEKKLRKISASDNRELRLAVRAKDKKDAEKKFQAWLLKFQNLVVNKYGTLPCKYNTTGIDVHPSLKGYYRLEHTGYCSDYVNMNTICKKAYAAVIKDGEYVGDDFFSGDYTNQFDFTYQSSSPNNKHYLDSWQTLLTIIRTKYNPGYTGHFQVPNLASLKKESDSVRISILMEGVQQAKLLHYSSKNGAHTLYDIAKGKGQGVCAYLANMQMNIANHLSINVMDTGLSCTEENHEISIIGLKNSFGSYDYFETNNVSFVVGTPTGNAWLDEKYQLFYYDSKILKKAAAWTKNKNYCELAVSTFKMNIVPLLTDENVKLACGQAFGSTSDGTETITWKLTNKNKQKYGFSTRTGSFEYEAKNFFCASYQFRFYNGKLYYMTLRPLPGSYWNEGVEHYVCDCTMDEAETKAAEYVESIKGNA